MKIYALYYSDGYETTITEYYAASEYLILQALVEEAKEDIVSVEENVAFYGSSGKTYSSMADWWKKY